MHKLHAVLILAVFLDFTGDTSTLARVQLMQSTPCLGSADQELLASGDYYYMVLGDVPWATPEHSRLLTTGSWAVLLTFLTKGPILARCTAW